MTKKRIFTLALCLILAFGLMAGTTAFAAEAPVTVVPDSQIAQEINGKQVLTRVFRVKESVSPQTLIVDKLTVDGYNYTFASITQDVEGSTDEKTVQVKVQQVSQSESLADSIKLFDAELLYDEDGYTGSLHIDPKSIITVVSATEQKGGTVKKSATKTYTLDTNDPALVPETITEGGRTLQLTNLSWQEGEYLPDSSIPTYYTATATYQYSQTSYKDVPTEYTTTATYTGTASKAGENTYTYTLTYTGTPVTADYTAMVSGLARGVGITAAVAVLLIILVLLLRYILSMFAKVQAQDGETGEYVKIQTVRLSQKAPMVKLDMLKMPDTKHYLITMKESCARRMRGKIILVQAGQETIQHKVEAIYGKKYTINVDLE